MHFALHCNSLRHVTQSSVHQEMPAFLAREMLLAFQIDALNSVAVISFFPEAADQTSHGWTRGSSCCSIRLLRMHLQRRYPSRSREAPIAIKSDGLAAGKGVTVAMTLEEAYEAVDSMLVEELFGSSGCKVIVQEYLEREEASFFALVDGENAIALESAQDHK
ncbi:hypothetical protein NL676_009508 [Syzygium grande]|nr:hypothetical protein NL676_009508 [Syzygium grande]